MKKKIMSIVVVAMLILTVTQVQSAVADVSGNSKASYGVEDPSPWAASDVKEAEERGFVPDSLKGIWRRDITRQQFCELVVKSMEAMGYQFDNVSGGSRFSDTDSEAVEKAAGAGIINGTGNGRFSPENSIRRQDAAVILYRMAQLGIFPEINDSAMLPHSWDDSKYFSGRYLNGVDQSYIFPYARDAVSFCYNIGLMAGTGNNCFSPNSPYTIEQSAVTMLRLYRWKSGTLNGNADADIIKTLPDDNRAYEYGYHTEGASERCYRYGIDGLEIKQDSSVMPESDGILIRRADGTSVNIDGIGEKFSYVKFINEKYAEVVPYSRSDEYVIVSLDNGRAANAQESAEAKKIISQGAKIYNSPYKKMSDGVYRSKFMENMDGTYTYVSETAEFVICDASENIISPVFSVAGISEANLPDAVIECMYGRYLMSFYEKATENADEQKLVLNTYICDRNGKKLSGKISGTMIYRSVDTVGGLVISSPARMYEVQEDTGIKTGDAVVYDEAGAVVHTFKNVRAADFYGNIVRVREVDGILKYYTPSGCGSLTCNSR